jgi:hypothetical protein
MTPILDDQTDLLALGVVSQYFERKHRQIAASSIRGGFLHRPQQHVATTATIGRAARARILFGLRTNTVSSLLPIPWRHPFESC